MGSSAIGNLSVGTTSTNNSDYRNLTYFIGLRLRDFTLRNQHRPLKRYDFINWNPLVNRLT